MSNWKHIHSGFTPELQKEWKRNNFTYNQTQDWINIGLTPDDCSFAVYLRDVIKCEPEEALNFVSNIEELRNQYQEYLQSQNEESEENQLIRAITLSLGIFDFSDNPLKGITDEEAEQYLSTKRLSLKKYFVFNLGQEIKITPKITVSDGTGEIKSDPIPNIRQVKPLLAEHLTQLFNDRDDKSAISFTGKNTNQPSQEWSGDRLDHKIKNGEEVYIVFDKSRIKANSSYVRSKADSVTQLGYMDWPEIIVLAMEAKPQVQVFQSKKNALKFLRDGDTSLFVKGLTADENELLKQMGVDSSKYEVAELKRILKYADIAKRNIDKRLPAGEGEIKKIIFFSPPHFQDKDCAAVVSEGKIPFPVLGSFGIPALTIINVYDVSLLVYEAPWQHIGDKLYVRRPVRICLEQGNAEREADELVKELMDKNNPYPACAVFDKVGHVFSALSFDGNIEGVEGFKLFGNIKNNPDGLIKSLDIIRVKGNPFYSHVAIYLGKDKHGKHKVAQVTSDPNKAEIVDWKEIHKNYDNPEFFRYHVFVTYKKSELIKDNIASAIGSAEHVENYHLLLRNCQHFANICVLGLNISNEATLFKKNRPLREEINENNLHFKNLAIIRNMMLTTGDKERYQEAKKKINECFTQVVYKPLWEWKQKVELKPASNCKLQ